MSAVVAHKARDPLLHFLPPTRPICTTSRRGRWGPTYCGARPGPTMGLIWLLTPHSSGALAWLLARAVLVCPKPAADRVCSAAVFRSRTRLATLEWIPKGIPFGSNQVCSLLLPANHLLQERAGLCQRRVWSGALHPAQPVHTSGWGGDVACALAGSQARLATGCVLPAHLLAQYASGCRCCHPCTAERALRCRHKKKWLSAHPAGHLGP